MQATVGAIVVSVLCIIIIVIVMIAIYIIWNKARERVSDKDNIMHMHPMVLYLTMDKEETMKVHKISS